MNTEMLLKDLARLPSTADRDAIAAKARKGRYHMRECTGPAVALARDLEDAGFYTLAARASQGRYDDDPRRHPDPEQEKAG